MCFRVPLVVYICLHLQVNESLGETAGVAVVFDAEQICMYAGQEQNEVHKVCMFIIQNKPTCSADRRASFNCPSSLPFSCCSISSSRSLRWLCNHKFEIDLGRVCHCSKFHTSSIKEFASMPYRGYMITTKNCTYAA